MYKSPGNPLPASSIPTVVLLPGREVPGAMLRRRMRQHGASTRLRLWQVSSASKPTGSIPEEMHNSLVTTTIRQTPEHPAYTRFLTRWQVCSRPLPSSGYPKHRSSHRGIETVQPIEKPSGPYLVVCFFFLPTSGCLRTPRSSHQLLAARAAWLGHRSCRLPPGIAPVPTLPFPRDTGSRQVLKPVCGFSVPLAQALGVSPTHGFYVQLVTPHSRIASWSQTD